MEQNHQITLTEWMEMKEAIRKELNNVKHSFIRVGYYLRRIDDEKAYLQDGYDTLADFAREEYGINPTTVSRFMSINRKYSVDGYSRELLPEYDGYKQSVLIEMLALPAEDMEIVTPEMSREDVREMARFNRAEGRRESDQNDQDTAHRSEENDQNTVENAQIGEENGPEGAEQAAGSGILSSDELAFMTAFYAKNEEEEEELEKLLDAGIMEDRKIQEILAPSGSRTYRSGLYMLIMTDKGVSIKRMGKETISLSYRELMEETADLIRDDLFVKRKAEEEQKAEEAAKRQQDAAEKQRIEQEDAAKTQREKEEAAGEEEPGSQKGKEGRSNDVSTEEEGKKEELPQEVQQSGGQEVQGDGESNQGAEEIDNGSNEAAGDPEGHDRHNDGSTGGAGEKSGMGGETGEPDPERKEDGTQAIAPAQSEDIQGGDAGDFAEKMNPPETDRPVIEDTGICHTIRIWPEYFEAVLNGTKTFELRKDDRDYSVGDSVVLMEFTDGRFTGRSVKKRITFKLSDFDGLQEGYCIFSIQNM